LGSGISKLETSGRTKLEGNNPHLRLQGNTTVKLENELREEKRYQKYNWCKNGGIRISSNSS
jgi:hypothetical protein